MNPRALTMGLLVATLVGLVSLGVTKPREIRRPPPLPLDASAVAASQWGAMVDGGIVEGPPNAKVRIVMFTDFECPFCREADRVLNQLLMADEHDITIIHRQYPLSTHTNAFDEAVLAVCADDAGVFTDMKRLLYTYNGLARPTLDSMVAELPRAGRRVSECFLERRAGVIARVHADLELAEALGSRRTPSIVVEGRLLSRTPNLGEWAGLLTDIKKLPH